MVCECKRNTAMNILSLDLEYSQICTTIEQSQRLLDFGLNPETADMSYYILDDEPILTIGMAEVYRETLKGGKVVETKYARIIPAWSLHRLLEMYVERYMSCNVNLKELTFDWLINEIEIHITENDFNKEYLKQ